MRGFRFPAWYLLLVAVLGILDGCQSLRDLERYSFGEGFRKAMSQPEDVAPSDPQSVPGETADPFRGNRSRGQPQPRHQLDRGGGCRWDPER